MSNISALLFDGGRRSRLRARIAELFDHGRCTPGYRDVSETHRHVVRLEAHVVFPIPKLRLGAPLQPSVRRCSL